MESPEYVLACHRYIELNPVRAGMAPDPLAYSWSSYAANSGLRSDPLLRPHCEYLALGTDTATRYAAYRQLFDQLFPASLLGAIREAERGKPGPRVETPTAGYTCEPAVR